MTALALGLVLLSAFIHASWNLLAKRGGGGVAFIWLFATCSSLIYAPIALAVFLLQKPDIGGMGLLFMAGSGLIHNIYFILLQKGYQIGDLSLVYPLARGTGPLLSTMVAIAILGEHPTPMALLGLLLIAIGAFLLTGNSSQAKRTEVGTVRLEQTRRVVAYGLGIGAIIATYTIWDKQAVSALMVPPLLMDYGSNLSRVLLLTPLALRRWQDVQTEWQIHRWETLGIACLSPLAYILVLTALAFTPVSYVAPLREISIVIGVLMGTRLLAEANATRRLAAAGVMVLGAIAIAMG